MIKYFIEREDGSWLMDPERVGAGWTRNPLKAWIFETEFSGMFYLSPTNNGGCLLPSGMVNVLNFLEKEGLGPLTVSEHNFTPCREHCLKDSNSDLWISMRQDGEYKRVSSITEPVITKGGFQYKISV